MYKQVLNIAIPESDTQNKLGPCFFKICHSFLKAVNAIGSINTVANDHLKKARVIGGICWFTPLAITKLPAQIMAAIVASSMPMYLLLRASTGKIHFVIAFNTLDGRVKITKFNFWKFFCNKAHELLNA